MSEPRRWKDSESEAPEDVQSLLRNHRASPKNLPRPSWERAAATPRAWDLRWVTLAAAAASLVLWAGLKTPSNTPESAPSLTGVVAQGSVISEGRLLSKNDSLGLPISIQTKDQAAVLTFGDGDRLELSAQGSFTLTALAECSPCLTIHSGSAKLEAHPRSAQASPLMVQADPWRVRVLGTRFSVERHAPHDIRVEVERGEVQVEGPQPPRRVQAGQHFDSRDRAKTPGESKTKVGPQPVDAGKQAVEHAARATAGQATAQRGRPAQSSTQNQTARPARPARTAGTAEQRATKRAAHDRRRTEQQLTREAGQRAAKDAERATREQADRETEQAAAQRSVETAERAAREHAVRETEAANLAEEAERAERAERTERALQAERAAEQQADPRTASERAAADDRANASASRKADDERAPTPPALTPNASPVAPKERQLELLRRARQAKDPAVALAALDTAAALGPPFAEVASYRAARISLNRATFADAAQRLRSHIKTWPSGELAEVAYLDLIEAELRRGKVKLARVEMQHILQKFPQAASGAPLQFLHGELARADKAWAEAALYYARAARVPEFAPRALFLEALSEARSGNRSKARTKMSAYLKRFPKGPFADQARKALGEDAEGTPQ